MSYSHTRTQSEINSKTKHAQRVVRRIRGDLQQLKAFYDCFVSDDYISNLAHDLEIAMDNGCLICFTFFLYKEGTAEAAYDYQVKSDGSIDTHQGSGGFVYDEKLRGAKFNVHVTHTNGWSDLEDSEMLSLDWSNGNRPSTNHLQSSENRYYSSGTLGVSRTSFLRH